MTRYTTLVATLTLLATGVPELVCAQARSEVVDLSFAVAARPFAGGKLRAREFTNLSALLAAVTEHQPGELRRRIDFRTHKAVLVTWRGLSFPGVRHRGTRTAKGVEIVSFSLVQKSGERRDCAALFVVGRAVEWQLGRRKLR